MSRNGLTRADIDVGMMSDPKVGALARVLRDSIRTAAAVALYQAVVLASWREGRRLTVSESLPGWWLDPYDDLADVLATVGLLDADHRIPEQAWDNWHGPAEERIERYRDLAARGGKAKAKRDAEARAIAEGEAHAIAPGEANSEALAVPYATAHAIDQASQPAYQAFQASQPASHANGDDDSDHLDAWYRLTGSWPSKQASRWLDELARDYGSARLASALAVEWMSDPDKAKVIGRVRNNLASESHQAEKERVAKAKTEKEEERQRIESMPLEQRKANMTRLRDMMRDTGLLGKEPA